MLRRWAPAYVVTKGCKVSSPLRANFDTNRAIKLEALGVGIVATPNHLAPSTVLRCLAPSQLAAVLSFDLAPHFYTKVSAGLGDASSEVGADDGRALAATAAAFPDRKAASLRAAGVAEDGQFAEASAREVDHLCHGFR